MTVPFRPLVGYRLAGLIVCVDCTTAANAEAVTRRRRPRGIRADSARNPRCCPIPLELPVYMGRDLGRCASCGAVLFGQTMHLPRRVDVRPDLGRVSA